MDPIVFDTETELTKPGCQAPRMVCLSIAMDGETTLVHHTEARAFVEAMLESDRVLVGHNVAYDFGVIARKWPDLIPAIFDKYERSEVTDTMVRQKLIEIASSDLRKKKLPYSLEKVVLRLFGEEMDKDTWRMRYGKLMNVPLAWWPEGAKKYALDDARWTHKVFENQQIKYRLLVDQFRQARAAWWLHLMRCWGLKTDKPAIDKLEVKLKKQFTEVREKLEEAGLVDEKGKRETKVAHARMRKICNEKGLGLVLTPTGKPVLNKETCRSVGDELLELYGSYQGLSKKISTDIKQLRFGVVQPYFDVLKETGRTSASPNVQNLPRKGGFRECYIPRPGRLFAASDYSQFELRTVSQVILELGFASRLADALNAGFDPHLEIARRIVGCSYEEAARRLAAGDEEIDRARQVGKIVNFGAPGGLGVASLISYAKTGYGVVLTEQEARQLKNYWISAWPEFKHYFDHVGQLCEHGQDGRGTVLQTYVHRVRGGSTFTQACNSYFQGLAADCAKQAGFLIARACYVGFPNPGDLVVKDRRGVVEVVGDDWDLEQARLEGYRSVLFGARPVNFVHDEFIVEVDDDEYASESAEEVARLMIVGASKFLPDVPPLAEPYLMRRWSKSAKPVRVDGRLVPWEQKEKAA